MTSFSVAVAIAVFVKSEVRVRDPHIKKTEVLVGKFEKHLQEVPRSCFGGVA